MGERCVGRVAVGLTEASDDGTTLALKVGEAVGAGVETSVGCEVEGDAVGIGLVQRPQLKSQMGD